MADANPAMERLDPAPGSPDLACQPVNSPENLLEEAV
jgi:hypothetical protein